MPMSDARCRKCTARIPADAERCAECGYDPTPGLIGTAAAVVAAPVALFYGVVVVTSLAGWVTMQFTLGDAVGGLLAGTILFGWAVGVEAWYLQRRGRTAAGGR